MPEAIPFACHRCGAALQPPPGINPGQTITCPQCSALVKVPGDARTPPSGGVNPGRMRLVLAGALLYLLGGAGLALYCFDRNARKSAPASAPGETTTHPEDAPLAPLTTARPATVAVDAAEQRKINEAIARGVWYLKDHILPTGTWGDSIGGPWKGIPVGLASLPGLTLLECGVSRRDPVVLKAAAFVREHAPDPAGTYDTYERALAILFLDRLGDPRDEPLIQNLALCLIAGQRSDDGGWGYHCPNLDPKMSQDLLTRLGNNQQDLDGWRQVALKGGTYDPGRSDNSNTQFAILGLWAARRHHVAVDRSLARVDNRFRTSQRTAGEDPRGNNVDLDGSWDYSPAAGAVSISL